LLRQARPPPKDNEGMERRVALPKSSASRRMHALRSARSPHGAPLAAFFLKAPAPYFRTATRRAFGTSDPDGFRHPSSPRTCSHSRQPVIVRADGSAGASRVLRLRASRAGAAPAGRGFPPPARQGQAPVLRRRPCLWLHRRTVSRRRPSDEPDGRDYKHRNKNRSRAFKAGCGALL
jgi:hypothetical protein